MRVAVVGTGVAGLVASHLLRSHHELVVFESADWVGGHAHTVDVELDDGVHALDTGFLVYNEPGYPVLSQLFREHGVPTQESDMSFSVSCEETGLEYNGTSLNALFAQRANIFRPSFHRMVLDILRFYREAKRLLLPASDDPGPTLGEFLEQRGYSRLFIDKHLVPMASAIWSGEPGDLREFPAKYLAHFFHNHGFLDVIGRVRWRSVIGGSREYVRRLSAPFAGRIRLSTPVRAVRRGPDRVSVATDAGTEHFDHVVLAVHADQALDLLSDASPLERELLGAIRYQANAVVLHHDEQVLPRQRRAWASWNYHVRRETPEGACVTYYLNTLQCLRSRHHFCVTLNADTSIRPERVLGRWTYHHPVYTATSFAAQRRIPEIDGVRRTSFCGAWRGWGFHEDGARSAVESVARLAEITSREQRSLPRAGEASAT